MDRTHMFLFQVTFVFTNQVDGKLVPIESNVNPKMQGIEENENGFKSKPNPNKKSIGMGLRSRRRNGSSSIFFVLLSSSESRRRLRSTMRMGLGFGLINHENESGFRLDQP
ncbi:protein chromatin remodeling 25 [Quercus suber]|uniref:Protein chromatin remodeling 25 n=1 Tax=Quercus suber TaxID=58331 RepID=A0AAW0JL40_QUESU